MGAGNAGSNHMIDFFGKLSKFGKFIVPPSIQAILDGFGSFLLCSSL